MVWIVGIDEAGYGPNLGPLVMSSVACRVPDELGEANLWKVLAATVCQGKAATGRILVDDSKVVHAGANGLACLERGVLATAWRGAFPISLADYLTWLCESGLEDLGRERWYHGKSLVPLHVDPAEALSLASSFDAVCLTACVGEWCIRSVVIPTPRFNGLLDQYDSKGGTLAHGLTQLLRANHARLSPEEARCVFVDKHGGRNTYAAFVQDALSDGMVVVRQEGAARSVYEVLGLGCGMRVTFQPRADSEHFCVALASMVSKHLRERLMEEFNAFWQQHVPGLAPTAGYPGDATRFFTAIRATAAKLGIAEADIWRRK